MIFEMLTKMFSAKRLEEFWSFGDIRYGILNYVARFSLANDAYLVTETSKAHLYRNKFLIDGRLLRSKKTTKNGFTYDHVIPSNVIADELFKYRYSVDKMRDILLFSNLVTVLTDEENAMLSAGYKSKMPPGWQFFVSSPFARYIDCGLIEREIEQTVEVWGAITR
mgnify:CR=1 FL=1